MGSHLNSLLLSPYHLVSSENEDNAVLQLENQLLFSAGKGMPFSTVAESMEEAYETSDQAIKHNTAVALTQEVLHGQDSPTLQLFTLLRLCLPLYDNRSVYGFKTHRLLKSFAKALEKSGGISGKTASAQLLAWIKCPEPVRRGNTIICIPEIAVAHAHALCFPHLRHGKRGLSVGDIGGLCQRLTNMYKEKHKDLVLATVESGEKSITGIKVDKIAEVLASVLPQLNYAECKALVRVLLRAFTMGIGVKTFTGALGPGWASYLDYQMDLARLAIDYVNDNGRGQREFVCGVPFRAMTCDVVSSPYVMKWLFGKEENIKTYLAPKDGRLIMHSNGKWYVPLKHSNSTMRKRFVDLDSGTPLESKYTKKHMKILQQIKKNKDLFFNVKVAQGMLISYMLSDYEQDKNSYIFLLRGMKTLEKRDVEFMDVEVEQDEGTQPSSKKQKGTPDPNSALLIAQDTPQLLQAKPHPITVIATTTAPSTSSDKGLVEKGMIVQRKYDGDRMQAHIALDSSSRVTVKLFSKRGKPVHHLYTDVANELRRKITADTRLAQRELPCILDGEIIVVNSHDQTPLPWSSTKWRYDSGGEGMPLERAVAADSGIASVISSRNYGENLDDGEDAPVSCATLGALKVWDQLGSNEKKKMNVKIIEGARLLYVIFDVILCRGKNISNQPYVERLAVLKNMAILTHLTYSMPIQESYHIQNAQQLVKELTKAVQTKSEGLILKDPRAKYVFGKTNTQRKLKICGPDINCAVVGMGFTLSKNPRMWGLLTAIFSESKSEFLVYNRVESIEGDSPSTAAEHILSLPGRVSVDAMKSPPKEVDMPKYIVKSQEGADEIVRVSWITKDRALADYDCTAVFMSGLPQDIQWLCNPLECTFGLSQRGDLYPIEWNLPEKAGGGTIQVPRFPVARIQLDDHQRSDCDTPSSIKEKFQQAALESTCIQDFFKRRVMQLRRKPPMQNKLEELRRILMGKEFQTDLWPQRLDAMYMLDEFSNLLVKNSFDPLTQGERHVLCGGKNSSQWDPMLTKKIKIIESEEMMAANDQREADLPFLSQALCRLKKLRDNGMIKLPITEAKFSANTLSISSPPDIPEQQSVFTLPYTNHDNDDCEEENQTPEEDAHDENDPTQESCPTQHTNAKHLSERNYMRQEQLLYDRYYASDVGYEQSYLINCFSEDGNYDSRQMQGDFDGYYGVRQEFNRF